MDWLKIFTKVVTVERRYTDAELLGMVAERLGNINDLSVEGEADELNIYTRLSGVDGFVPLLRDTMAKDIRRFFATPDGVTGEHDRSVIRGGFARTAHFASKILKITGGDLTVM